MTSRRRLLTRPLGGATRALSALALGVGIFVAGCSSARKHPLRPMLSDTVEAQHDFRDVLRGFSHADGKERIAFEAELVRFQERFPDDELVRAADVLLAWIELERGDPKRAGEHARLIQIAGPGEVSDLARTVQGAALRRGGQPLEALKLLEPLEGKVIDGYARELLNEELVASGIASAQWRKAVHYLAVWLREAEPERRDAVKLRITEAAQVIPLDELMKALERGKRLADEGLPDAEANVRTIYAHRLAGLARQNKDVALAQKLLATAGGLLGEDGDSVAQLAAGAVMARVEPRTVGLFVSIRDEASRQRGVEVAEGVAFGLGLPGSTARLVSRDDGGEQGSVDAAMQALSTDGASIILGGTSELEGAAMARFAAKSRVPVVLFRSRLADGASPYVFSIGEDLAEADRALVEALEARGARPAVVVMDPATVLAPWGDVAVRRCGDVGAPLGPARGLVLGGGEGCSRDALQALTSLKVRLAAGFEAEATPLPAGALVATAGLYPIDASAPPEALRDWFEVHDTPPSWFSGLGRDAAVLALAALKSLPARGTEDPREVVTYRMGAAAAFERAHAPLWTSDAKGFGGARILPRSIGVREATASKPTSPNKR